VCLLNTCTVPTNFAAWLLFLLFLAFSRFCIATTPGIPGYEKHYESLKSFLLSRFPRPSSDVGGVTCSAPTGTVAVVVDHVVPNVDTTITGNFIVNASAVVVVADRNSADSDDGIDPAGGIDGAGNNVPRQEEVAVNVHSKRPDQG